MTKLTPDTFDALTRTRAPAREDRVIWTLGAIGQRIGRGRDFVRDLAKADGTPIKQKGRQYFAIEDELIAFLKRK